MAASSCPQIPVESASESLDRASFNVYEQPERFIVDPLKQNGFKGRSNSGRNDAVVSTETDEPSRLAKLAKKVRTKAKQGSKQTFRPIREHHGSSDTLPAPILAPSPSKPSDDDRLYNDLPKYKGMQTKELLHHPVDTVQSALHGASGAKFAEVMDNQVIAHSANVGLVRAWEKIDSAQDEEGRDAAMNEVCDLKKERQDMYVRWTMDRHVLKVRQDPPRTMERPRRQDYQNRDEEGKTKTQWADYGQQVRYLLP